jgi:hypothetical protein
MDFVLLRYVTPFQKCVDMCSSSGYRIEQLEEGTYTNIECEMNGGEDCEETVYQRIALTHDISVNGCSCPNVSVLDWILARMRVWCLVWTVECSVEVFTTSTFSRQSHVWWLIHSRASAASCGHLHLRYE